MNAEEVLLRDDFLLGLELKLFSFVTFLYALCFITGIAYLMSSKVGIGTSLAIWVAWLKRRVCPLSLKPIEKDLI
jgi:hypothetical protein